MPKIPWSDKRVRIGAIAVVAVVLGALAASLLQPTGPSWDFEDERIAAQVNDVAITEGEVSRQVYLYREVVGCMEDDAWRAWLKGKKLTPEGFRLQRIDALVHAEIVGQAAAQEGIVIADSEVKAAVEEAKTTYVEGLIPKPTTDAAKDDAWTNALRLNGYTDETYEAATRTGLLEDALATKVGWGTGYATWLDEFEESCDVSIEPMPEGLPYA